MATKVFMEALAMEMQKENPFLDFALSYDLVVTNTSFKKKDTHLITFKTRSKAIQSDSFLIRIIDGSSCLNYKIIPRECVATQHKLFV